MFDTIDFAGVFSRLEHEHKAEETTKLGGMKIRLVRVKGRADGHWDQHDGTPETVIVWRGDFKVEFHEHTVNLSAGECCVVPAGVEHRGTSQSGAEIILFQQAH